MHGCSWQCPAGREGCNWELWGRKDVVSQTIHHRWRNAVPRALMYPHTHIPSPYHYKGGSWLSVWPPHPTCQHDIAAHHAMHPSDVMLHHCSNIPFWAAVTSSTATTLRNTMQQGPHHTPKAPQSSDMVTSQYPMTSCCLCPSNIILPFWPFPGCHSFTHQGR